ncbi:hypothetical protein HDU93_002644, partial [Gonapodya sp. JEL0774]
MDALPIEILHRIFRRLPPITFYREITRTCRSFHRASLNAIPGCPEGAMGYECTVTVLSVKDWSYDRKPICKLSPAFRPEEQSAGTIWTCLSVEVDLSAELMATLELGQEHSFVQRAALKASGRDPDSHESPIIVVSHLHWNVRSDRAFWDKSVIALAKTLSIVKLFEIRSIEFGNGPGAGQWGDAPVDQLMELPSDVEADCVKIVAAANDDESTWYQYIATLLRMFPSAHTIQGTAFFPAFETGLDHDSFCLAVPSARRAFIKSLDIRRPCTPSILEAPVYFPNLERLGTVELGFDAVELDIPFSYNACKVRTLLLGTGGELEYNNWGHEQFSSFADAL